MIKFQVLEYDKIGLKQYWMREIILSQYLSVIDNGSIKTDGASRYFISKTQAAVIVQDGMKSLTYCVMISEKQDITLDGVEGSNHFGIPPARCYNMVYNMMRGMDLMHGLGVISRDIKLENMVLSKIEPLVMEESNVMT